MKTKRQLKRTSRPANNFTLVELLCACVITAIIIAAAIALINTVQWSMVQTYRMSRAMAIANSRIEQLHAAHFVDLPLMEENEITVDDSGIPSNNGIYRRRTIIGGESRASREINVQIKVPWKPGMPEIEVNLTTIINSPEIFKVD